MKGYAGQILHIDLSTKSASTVALDEKVTLTYLGGMGLSNYLAWHLIPPGVDPLAPENPVIIAAGGLGGTLAPGSGRVMATTKLPVNGAVGTFHGGGSLAARLKWAGYDAVSIRGKADTPVYLDITPEGVEFVAAEELWGQDILATTHALWRKHGEAGVLAIGPAGERQVKISFALVDNVSTLGRGGLGAVFGSKNLKAVAVHGGKGLKIGDWKRFLHLTSQTNDNMLAIKWRPEWLKKGIYMGWPMWRQLSSVRNWQERYPLQAMEAFGPEEYLKHHKHTLACPSCPLGDKAAVVCDGPSGQGTYPISYGLQAALAGPRVHARDEGETLRFYVEANRQGIDDLMLASLIDFAVELFQNGVISLKDTEGIVLRHDRETFETLFEQIVNRKGLGEILGEGFLGAVNHFGPASAQYAVHIKGMDPIVDPRPQTNGFAVAQMVNPRGAYLIPGNSPGFLPDRSVDSFRRFLKEVGAPPERAEAIAVEGDLRVGRMLRYTEDWYALFSSLGICARQPVIQSYSPDTLAETYSASTGTEVSAQELLLAGERIWNLYRMVNAREGFGRKDDQIPDEFLKPLKNPDGDPIKLMDYYHKKELSANDVGQWLDEYYAERGWDGVQGRPTPEKLKELGLEFCGELKYTV